MDMLCLRIEAPFAAFRTFTAGSFRPTAPFLTPSAAYGLLLNLAGVEMRDLQTEDVMTRIATGLPRLRIALGELRQPRLHTVYQQLHNYPVGSTGKEHKPKTKGSKYNIAPVRRAFLSDVAACVAVQADSGFLAAVRDGLEGHGSGRYGLPFLGDNNFLLDRAEVVAEPLAARWWRRVDSSEDSAPGASRLTMTIDRTDWSRTTSALFAPAESPSQNIPESAWVEVGY